MKPSPSRIVAGLTAAGAVAALVTGLFGSCGRKAGGARPPRPQSPPEQDHNFLATSDLGGHWQWSHIEDADGVRRVENEHWYLDLVADTVTGHYQRVVTFLSRDGVPFECSQALRYRLTTDYQVIGTADSNHLEISEIGYQVAASPCERGFRQLADYRGELRDGQLVLSWPGGSQTLTRTSAPSVAPAPATVSGSFTWRNRHTVESGSEVRVETEDWELGEAEHGAVTGTYLRTVTVFDTTGQSYDCASASHYQYRDRYTVVGVREGNRLILSETAAVPDDHPCVERTDRHLDAATGTVGEEFLSLVWRGRHLQVLQRSMAQ